MSKQPTVIQSLASLAVDYFRWTQLTPMILMWAMALLLLGGLFFVSHQEATWDLAKSLVDWIAALPWVGPKFVAFLQSQAEDGVISPDLGGIDFESAVLTAWGAISAVFMFIAWLAGSWFGPFRPWPLGRKLGLAAVACILVVATFLALYLLDRETWNDSLWKILLSATGMALVLFLTSAWCLSVSHWLGRFSGWSEKRDLSGARNDGKLQ